MYRQVLNLPLSTIWTWKENKAAEDFHRARALAFLDWNIIEKTLNPSGASCVAAERAKYPEVSVA